MGCAGGASCVCNPKGGSLHDCDEQQHSSRLPRCSCHVHWVQAKQTVCVDNVGSVAGATPPWTAPSAAVQFKAMIQRSPVLGVLQTTNEQQRKAR